MKIKDFVIATTVAEARAALRRHGDAAYLLAGGTSTFFIKSRAPKIAVDITRLPNAGITRRAKTYRIGAGTTINRLLKYAGPGWVLDRVARRFVNQQVRNLSTIGGNVARVFYWADFPVALRALEGTVTLAGGAARKAAIATAFHNASAHRAAFTGAILEHLEVPRLGRGMGFGYSKETRTAAAFSALTVAAFARVERRRIAELRIAVGTVVPFPVRLFDVEQSLVGQPADGDLAAAVRWDSLGRYALAPREGMSPEYCRHLLQTRVLDVVREAVAEAAGGAQ